ncbi:unnamed protein product [Prorocentrum cordatum]|uniref:Aurora kinase n=1 Tax=Prorocentrum cordatum TaxID=2364126 RepID=A0ABN9R687_9DINO|nr:unnamed protein product [Polarella glacialis]
MGAGRSAALAEQAGAGGAPGAAATDTVVDAAAVAERRGNLPVQGRYSSSRRIEQDFVIDSRVVGSGMNGPVQMATSRDPVTGRGGNIKYAVKSFKKRGMSAKKRAELQSEVEIYICLDHPHVARLEMVYETDEELHLVMEFMAGGELYDRLSERKQYTEEAAADTTRQMLLAVAYLHAQSVVHRDLNAAADFLYERKDTDHLKLIDFGFAKHWDRGTRMSQACGSVHYVAPEVLKHSYTEKADVWSLGVIVYMLLTGSPPFHGGDDEVLKKIKSGQPHFSSRFRRLSEPARSFVENMLVYDPVKRMSAHDALGHAWMACRSQKETVIDPDILKSLRDYSHASSFRRCVLSMMAWSLTREDRLHLRDQFLRLDTENTGTLTHGQMKAVLQETFHIESSEAEVLFASLDTDHDNKIAYSEFLAAGMTGHVKIQEDVLWKTFQRFARETGQDKQGVITAACLREVLGPSFDGARLSDEDIEDLIREADTTGDGTVDYDEFLAYFHRAEPDDEAPMPPDLAQGRQTDQMCAVIETLISASQASHVMMEGADGQTLGTLCKVEMAEDGLRFFRYTCVRYLWDEPEGRFRPGGLETCSAAAARERWLVAKGLSEPEWRQRGMAGPNAIEIDVPGLLRSVVAEFLSAIYIFQFSCIWVYMFYSTWNIATIWLVLAAISGPLLLAGASGAEVVLLQSGAVGRVGAAAAASQRAGAAGAGAAAPAPPFPIAIRNALPSSTAANPCVERGGNSLKISTPSGEQVLIPPGASATLVDDWASSGGVGVQINTWYWSFSRPAVSAVVSSPGPKNPDNAGVTVRLGADCVAEALEAPPQCCGVRTDFVSNVTVGWNAERRCEVTVAANEWTNAVTPGCCSYGAAGSGSACSEVPTLSAGLRTATGQVSWPPRWLAVAPGWPGATPVPSWGAAPPPSQATHTPAPAPVPTAPCHTAAPGEECHGHVAWAKQDGIRVSPQWYPGLSPESSFEDFQEHLWMHGLGECERPCESARASPTPAPTPPALCHTAAPGEELLRPCRVGEAGWDP